MKPIALIVFLGSTALVPVAQAQPASQTSGECDRLVTMLEQAGSAGTTMPMSLDQARSWQRANDVRSCQNALPRIEAAVGTQGQAPVQQNARAAQPGEPVQQQTQAARPAEEPVQPAAQAAQSGDGQVQPGAEQDQAQAGLDQGGTTVPQPPAQMQVSQPQPDVQVVQPGQPQVQGNQVQPQVAQPEQQGQAQVEVQQGQAQVEVQQGQAQVQVEQEPPLVRYERMGEPRVVVNQPEGQPQVRYEPMAQPGQQGQAPPQQTQAAQNPPNNQPQQRPDTFGSDAADRALAQPGQVPHAGRQGQAAQKQTRSDETGAVPAAGAAAAQMQTVPVSRIAEMDLFGEGGEKLGEVDRVMIGQDDRMYVVMTRGGFLGLGEKQLAFPLDQLAIRGNDQLVLRGMTEDQIRAMPAWEASGAREISGDQTAQLQVSQ